MSKSKPISPERAARLRRIAANFRIEQATGVYGLNLTPERIARGYARVGEIIGHDVTSQEEADFCFQPFSEQEPPIQ